ncbi:BQ2448_2303 [Microbotryum intermedium]|uniref:BQ2448_2303 protein n=1 Tax=Microbotryum intermedium TaxID=269621 RepID=A0A238FBA2_9BASI|nr:BQ2448_2303 [Microbotryum intermedium]
MSLLSDLVHLPAIEVAPRLTDVDDVIHLATTTTSDSHQRTGTMFLSYACSPGQLLRSSTNFSIDLLKALCRAHNVQGNSKTQLLAKEWFLHALLWSCEPNCKACSNEYVFKRRQAANHVAATSPLLPRPQNIRIKTCRGAWHGTRQGDPEESPQECSHSCQMNDEQSSASEHELEQDELRSTCHVEAASDQLKDEIRTEWNN